jgi:DNA-directed RNA polymerase subunit H
MASNKHIINIYNSRKHILEILKTRGFDTTSYNNFDINEIQILSDKNELDMLVKNDNDKKIYVKYYVNKVIKTQNIYSIVDDLFHLENILTKNDDLILIIKDEPNDTLQTNVKDIWMSDGIYVSLINIKRLQFNILEHNLVPKHESLSLDEIKKFKKNFNILNNDQIPDISFFSPISIVMGFRPDDIIKITRKSPTSINSYFYRICKF